MLLKNKVRTDVNQAATITLPSPTQEPTVQVQKGNSGVRQGIFVPYWAVSDQPLAVTAYNDVIYFGVAASSSGNLEQDAGLATVTKFSQQASNNNQQTFLTLRMIGSDTDFTILQDPTKQQSLMKSTITMAKDNHFNGIVLDLELSALPFDSVEKQIDTFVTHFSQTAKQNKLHFAMLMYGDTFYRLRPFDVKYLSHHVDTIMVMSYDFSKANGDPGPNFPLTGAATYGYDMTKMITDFLQAVPANKLTVVLGRFGYDWQIGPSGHSVQPALPLTDAQIEQKFLHTCRYSECMVHHDPVSSETEITYTDSNKQKHVVWFEDEQSIAAKKRYLQQRGITSFGDWAYSYF